MIKMKLYKKILIGFSAITMLIAMGGCNRANQSPSADTTENGETGATIEVSESTEDLAEEILNINADNALIYCITPSPENPYFLAIQTACTEEGESLGYRVKCVSHDDDAEKQSALFDEAISEGASAIVCVNAGADASIEAVQKARDAGIPTFLVDREINQENVAISQIIANNSQGAAQAAQYLAEATGGEGQYAELLGTKTDRNSKVRSAAFHAVLDQTNMEMVEKMCADWDEKEAQKKTESILQQYPDIIAIVCGNDTMACGAAKAVETADLGHSVYIIGVDGSDAMRDNIKSNRCLATALQQIDLMTRNAVKQADAYLSTGSTDMEEKQLVDCVLITKDNVNKLENFVYAK